MSCRNGELENVEQVSALKPPPRGKGHLPCRAGTQLCYLKQGFSFTVPIPGPHSLSQPSVLWRCCVSTCCLIMSKKYSKTSLLYVLLGCKGRREWSPPHPPTPTPTIPYMINTPKCVPPSWKGNLGGEEGRGSVWLPPLPSECWWGWGGTMLGHNHFPQKVHFPHHSTSGSLAPPQPCHSSTGIPNLQYLMPDDPRCS